ncbi:disks large-like 5-like isoform X1 [Solea senegalensis]|uniref:Disks large-like 5-like isoform X1 n=1 Tax=Solea senegalensis TaxID=28829 RepID=A0AAV6RQ17_SOLSE|nr:disks large homolog 5-like isoform X1 [Solea senegalensis]KAG7507592.1 disks large-like 5-like isoform X1 [Solea senegalensis]
MEPKHKELLEKCYQNLVESITDVERVVDVLVHCGTLSPSERYELGHSSSSNSEKVDLLLKRLLSKDRDHFAEFCSALETTHPHLHSVLLNGSGPVDHTTGSTYSVLSTMPSDSESSSSLSSLGTPAQASSPPPVHMDSHAVNEKMETVLFQLRHVTRERDELRKRLALSSPGTTFDDCRPNSKAGHDYERLKLQCMKAMADLQSLQNQHSSTLKRCEEAVKKADFYHTLHSRQVSEHAQMKDELEAVRQDNIQLVREHNHVKQACEELRRLHDEDQREVADMRMLHQQVMREGSSDVLNKLYDTAVDKLEATKGDYEALRKRYNEKTASHNADLSRLDQAEEENHRLQKQLDMLLKQRDAAIHYQQQYSSSIRRFDSTHQELSKAASQNKELQREMERLQSEATRLKTQQLKAVKDCEKYKEERDSVISEYRLIMSERDQVIKEVDRLHTGLEVAEAKLKNTSSERRVANEELEALRQELASALVDRDRAICEKNELLEKYCHEVKDKAEAQKELSQACKDIETVREERDVARKERTEAIIQRDQLLREYYQARQKQDSATMDMERANKEIEVLRKQCEAISQELKEALQEAEVAKCRRDWAFQERDKIVAERESIRTLCDNLRRERDRAVSDLADALRNLDDMRKQKNDAVRELKELKEKMEDQLEEEARFRQLMAHSSHDSAIDTDSMEWETEVVEFEKHRDMDLKALGFDIAEGVNDPYLPGDCGIFVSKVDKGSIAEGRLRVNDWLLKINDVDLTNKDRKQVIKAVLSGEGVINMVVRRRKSLGGRIVTPIQINLAGHKDSGIGLESGVFVATLAPGSPATRDGTLTVGDRLLAINGIALDNKSLTECESLLRNCRDSLSISLMKFLPQSCSGQSLLESLKDTEKVSRLQTCEVHARNCRNSKHNCSTQIDTCNCDLGCRGKDTGDSQDSSSSSTHSHHKAFSNNSLHSRSLSTSHAPSEPHPDFCYRRQEIHHRPLTFTPAVPDCSSSQMARDQGQNSPGKPGGGTWPKVIAGASIPEYAQLSIYKKPKQRKSIFDVTAFRRPEPSPKLDYMSVSQLPKHSPQSSISESAQTPPTPPARSDSFRYKHRHQNSSASDSTITTGTPPASPAQATGPQDKEETGNHFYYSDAPPTETKSTAKKPAEDEKSRHRIEGQEKRRYRPKSAPALRRNVTPLHIPVPMVQSFSNDEYSPEPVDLLRFSPMRTNRYSVPFAPPSYSSIGAHSAQRGLAPCPAVTAVMRNPVYTAWSHEIQNNNSPPAPSSGVHQHPHTSPQHQCRLSLDLSHKRAGESTDIKCSQPSHNTNSLPSSARLGSLSTLQFRAERIKIPPTRYPRSTGSDRGSLTHSECSSPTPPMSPVNLETTSFTSSPSQSSISTQPRISVSPALVGDRRKDGPYLEEPRNVTIQKGAEPLGISIVSGENGGVFVSKVTAGSIAHQVHLTYGDQLLEFNGINLRNANEQQARLVIGQQCDTVTILAQYNPHMFQLGNHSRSGSRMESISNQPTPQTSGATTPDNSCAVDTLSEHDEGTMTPPSKQTTPATSPLSSFRLPGSSLCRATEPRLVRLKKVQVELGVQICGGNLYGIFVESLDDDSPAKCPDGLLPGDLLLEYNGVSMKNKTKEEAYLEMLKPAETITCKVQNCVDNLAAIKETPGDAFFIRALYERVAESEQELSFKKDDILFVEDTLPNGNFGYWMAWQLDENAHKLGRGQIPSKYMMDQEFCRRHSMADMKDDNGANKTMSAAARRSFFRRRLKHKRSGSKDGKDLMALDAISTDSLPIAEDGGNLMYQRVQKVESSFPRPVLVLGPLVEASKDMLVKEAPSKFCRCLPEIMKASQQAIERGVKDCVFIDYKRRSGHFDVTTVASIKEITEKDCHCLLDIAPHAIERLHSVHIYPIVIFIRYKNAKQIKEQKDPLYLRDKLSQKHSKEQFEAAQRIEQEFCRFFTGVVQGGSVAYICTQIMTVVEQEQSKVLWIPDGAP